MKDIYIYKCHNSQEKVQVSCTYP